MPNRWISSVGLLCLLMLFLPEAAFADAGPKPSVIVDIKGLEADVYYVTLLSEGDSTGPYRVSREELDLDHYLIRDDPDYGLEVWQAFRDYQDVDGFHFLEYFQRCDGNCKYSWGYYPPQVFKVLIYLPTEDIFLTSEISQRYAFVSSYVAQRGKGDSLALVENRNYIREGAAFLMRVVTTLLVELLIAFVFGLWRKDLFGFIIKVNIFTQLLLNILLSYSNFALGGFGFILAYILLEPLVILIEGWAYRHYFYKVKNHYGIKKWIAWTYAVIANLASFVAGLLATMAWPGLF